MLLVKVKSGILILESNLEMLSKIEYVFVLWSLCLIHIPEK